MLRNIETDKLAIAVQAGVIHYELAEHLPCIGRTGTLAQE